MKDNIVPEKIRILIADDHPVYREGLRNVLEKDPSLEVIAEAEHGKAAIAALKETSVDVMILDIDMPHMNGLEVLRVLKDRQESVDVIMLTMYNEEAMFNEAMDLGVKGYVLKESAVADISASVHAVTAGHYFISPAISDLLVSRSDRAKALLRHQPSLGTLTPAERRILSLIAEKKTSKEIAEDLHISPKTVDNHRTNISKKLGIHGSHSLLKFAIENKSAL